MNKTSFVLASASPRRRQLFSMITGSFTVRPAQVNEAPFRALPPKKQAIEAARAKAAAILPRDGEAVIGCDTVVAIGKRALGKPACRSEAVEFLSALSGRAHLVYTAVSVISGGRTDIFCEKTRVRFYDIPKSEIESYADTPEPYDKAGGYGIQGAAALWVRGISGCYYNVMGLPVARLARLLKRRGLL